MRTSDRQRKTTFHVPLMNPTKKPWTEEEDAKLIEVIQNQGVGKWTAIGAKFDGRTGKQCRERWHNHLAPDVKKESWTEEEDRTILFSQRKYGNVWSMIATQIPGRTDNSIKNRFHVLQRAIKRGEDVVNLNGLHASASESNMELASDNGMGMDRLGEDNTTGHKTLFSENYSPRTLMAANSSEPSELTSLNENETGEMNAVHGLALLGSAVIPDHFGEQDTDTSLEGVMDGVMTFSDSFKRRGSNSPRGSFGSKAGSRPLSNYSSGKHGANSRRGSSERNSFMSVESSKSTYTTSSVKSWSEGEVTSGSGKRDSVSSGSAGSGKSDGMAVSIEDPGEHEQESTRASAGGSKTLLSTIFHTVPTKESRSPPGTPSSIGPAKKRNLSLWSRITKGKDADVSFS